MCPVLLSIGKYYQDEIWCDVLPTDAFRILLGRPWMYRKVRHDAFLNTCSFGKGGKKISLLPLLPSQLHSVRPTEENGGDKVLTLSTPLLKSIMMEYRDFREWILTSHEPTKPTNIQLHPTAELIIKKYSHVFPENMPNSLPSSSNRSKPN